MAEKDLLFGGTIPAAAENYVKAGRGFDKITMPSNSKLCYSLDKETFGPKNRMGSALKPTAEYYDQPGPTQAPGGSDDTAFRKLPHTTGDALYSEWDRDDGKGGRNRKMRDLTDPKYK